MRRGRIRIGLLAVVLALVAGGCATPPAPEPTPSDPGIGVCDPILYLGTVDEELMATSEPLAAPGFPFAQLADAGHRSTCAAHLSLVDADLQAAALDVALYNVPVDALVGLLDGIAVDAGWNREPLAAAPRWRDDAASDRVVRAIEIEEGVLVTISTPAFATCEGALFAENIDVPMTVEARGLVEPPFPLGDMAVDLAVTCMAHLVVDYAETADTTEFDVLVTTSSLDAAAAVLEPIAKGAGWERDSDLALWRDPDDQDAYVQGIEIPEGVLIAVTSGASQASGG